MISPNQLWSLVKESVDAWLEDRAPSMGAALAYYTAFSLAPLLIIAIAVAGVVFGRDAAQSAVVSQLQGLLGAAGGSAVEELSYRRKPNPRERPKGVSSRNRPAGFAGGVPLAREKKSAGSSRGSD